jgi:hypothetical protein
MSRPIRAALLFVVLFFSAPCAHQPAVPAQALPPLKVDPFAGLDPLGADEAQPFTFQKGPAPPPDVSERVKLPFPPPRGPEKVSPPAAPELKVLRTQPTGTEGLVGAVTATFNQPMIPVAALDELCLKKAPLEIRPQVEGRFRWLGTQTVAFEPQGRMPFGTRFEVRIPAGTPAQSGRTLEQEVHFEFSTPRPEIVSALPHRSSDQNEPDAALAFLFNQRVEAKALLEHLAVSHVPPSDLEIVPQSRWSGLRTIRDVVATWDPERTVVVKPKRPLPLATSFSVKVGSGLRGEGPLVTTKDIYHYFSTYGPLQVKEIRCGSEEEGRCQPDHGFAVTFTNPLVTGDLSQHLRLDPSPTDLKIEGAGVYFAVRGTFKPRSKVTLSVATGPRDVHGQPLQAPALKELLTGDLYPSLAFPAHGLAVLERRGERKVPLEVTSITQARLRLVRVKREQLLKVLELARHSSDDEGRRDPLKGIEGLVVTRTLKTGLRVNSRARLGLSTDEGLGKGGAGVLYLELRAPELQKHSKWENPFRGLVVSVTDIGLMARYDHDRIVAMATALGSGQALAGARLELRSNEGKVVWHGKTDREGVATAPGRRSLEGRPPYVLWADQGRDAAFTVLDASDALQTYLSSYSPWGYAPAKTRLKLFLFTDRNPYRPGETVHLKGVLRMEDATPMGGIDPLPRGLSAVSLQVQSPRGNKVLDLKEVKLTPSGAFTVEVPIPPGADLGGYAVHVNSSQGSAYGSFDVEEYRAPEFEVKVETAEGPYFLGDTLKAKVGADYLFGAPMAGAEAHWTLRRSETAYRPPKNEGFTFGEALPWWWRWQFKEGRRGGRHGAYVTESGAPGSLVREGKGVLDASGRLSLSTPLEPDAKGHRHGPAAFTLEAEVTDQNRQSIANRQVLTVHPASVYLGLRPEKTVVKAGEPARISSVLARLDGTRIAGTPLTLRALEVINKATPVQEEGVWQYRWETQETEVGACSLQTGADPAACAITLPKPGMYLVRSETKDDRGRLARTTLTIYAFGPGYVPWRLENQSKIELVPDKDSYAPGDVARVLVKSPLRAARGFLTLSRSGMVEHRVLQMKGNAQVVEVPISDRFLPEIYLGVALSRGRMNDPGAGKGAEDLGRPTFAHGQVRLPVSVDEKRIAVRVEPLQQAVRPSGTLDLSLVTADSRGRPAPAEVAVMVVDEGVLSLLNYQTPDPLGFFWASRSADTALQDNRDALLKREKALQPPEPRRARAGLRGPAVQTAMPAAAPMEKRRGEGLDPLLGLAMDKPIALKALSLEGKGEEGGVARIRSRSLFATTAYYNPSVMTDEEGRATLKITMPDNLTTFRIMAVALDRGRVDRFGKGEAQVKVRKPLLLRPSLPRFLSVGDSFEAAVMVHNETDREGEVDVLVRGRNVKLKGPERQRVSLGAHRAAEVRFALAPLGAGPLRLQFAAVLGEETDAVEKQLPVLLPATTEAFATYGMTDSSVVQTVVPPEKALAGYGGLEVSLSSTALGGLEDAVRYLVDYPYECTEQVASRILPIFALKDILRDFKIAKLSDLKQERQLAEEGARKLLSNQRWDGGWGMWSGSRISWPYLTAYALFTLGRAKEAGYQVPPSAMEQGHRFLKGVLDQPRSEFGEEYDYVTQALSVWSLSERKQYERSHMKRLYGLRKRLPLFARVWLMQALFRADGRSTEVTELLRELDNAAVETASGAHFSEIKTESLRLLLHSEERTDAIALYALLEVDPEHSLMAKLARGLIQSRVKGAWSTTQANAYALTALARYYRQIEKVVPDHVTRLWLGESGYLGQAAFKGRGMRVVEQEVPLEVLKKTGQQDLILEKSGPGKLYYRIGLRYAPESLRLPPEEQGFALTRTYEPLEGEKDTVRREENGTWKIKAGSTVRVRLTIVVPDRRYFVAVRDPLPAGLEAVNLRFATSASSRLGNQLQRKIYDFYSWYSLFAFDHQELRDDSVVLFADRLPSGVYEYTYLARATSFGRFIAAPTKAEEMYRPETFGRTGTGVVVVE